jgi:hypothetical protein
MATPMATGGQEGATIALGARGIRGSPAGEPCWGKGRGSASTEHPGQPRGRHEGTQPAAGRKKSSVAASAGRARSL